MIEAESNNLNTVPNIMSLKLLSPQGFLLFYIVFGGAQKKLFLIYIMARSVVSSSKSIDNSYYFSYASEDRETDREVEGESCSRRSCQGAKMSRE